MEEALKTLDDPIPPVQEDFHFYRCEGCKSILTREAELKMYKTGQICECGGSRYKPTNPLKQEWESEKIKAYCASHDLEPNLGE